MKILKNNYNNFSESKENIKVENYPKKHECEWCESEFEYDKDDTYIGAYGAAYVDCPCCNRDNILDDEKGIILTKDNIKFPQHFTQFGGDGCLEMSDKEIEEHIREGVKYFRNNKDENIWHWYSGTGDSRVSVYRYTGDEEYCVVVSKRYYETFIPFEKCDYF